MKGHLLLAYFATIAFCQAQVFEPAQTLIVGNCSLTQVSWYENNTLDYRAKNTYNTSGKLTRILESFSEKMEGPYTSEHDYVYDAKGNNTSIVVKKNGVQQSVILKTYSSIGQLLRETLMKEDGSTQLAVHSIVSNASGGNIIEKTFAGGNSKEVKVIDKNGNLISREISNPDGTVQMSVVNVYDNTGKITQKTTTDIVRNTIEVVAYSYSASGELFNEKTTRDGATFGEINYTYDAQGNVTSKVHINPWGKMDYTLQYFYDKNKNLIKLSHLAGTLAVISYTNYEYDSFGNKTKESYYDPNGVLTGYKEWVYTYK